MDPKSLRSSERGIVLTALPAQGYQGDPPAWPLAGQSDREADLWAWAWSTPQACAWANEPWRWHSVAMWVRVAVTCEGPMAQAADKNGLHRFADQIGLTPAGLKENGWAIAQDELASKRGATEPPKRTTARDRMKVVDGDAAGS